MRKARIADSGEIVNADDLLKYYPNYNEILFVCLDEKCSVRMAPSCITKNIHRKPHFKKYKNQDHIDTCEYAILNKLFQKGKTQKLNKTEIKKVGYPSVFDLRDINEEKVKTSKAKINSEDEGTTGRVNEATTLYEFDGDNIKFDRSNKVQSIERIVEWYLGFPNNRDVEIEILGEKIPYRYFFRRIVDFTDSVSLQNVQSKRIFYGRIMLSKVNQNVFIKDTEKVIITLFGFKDKDEANNINHYQVIIDKKSISKIMLSKLRNKYDELFEIAFREFKNQTYDSTVGLYVFLYGTVDKENDTILNVKQNHITFRYDEVRKTINDD